MVKSLAGVHTHVTCLVDTSKTLFHNAIILVFRGAYNERALIALNYVFVQVPYTARASSDIRAGTPHYKITYYSLLLLPNVTNHKLPSRSNGGLKPRMCQIRSHLN